MAKNPRKMTLQELSDNIEEGDQKLNKTFKKLEDFERPDDETTLLRRAVYFISTWVHKLKAEEQRRYDAGETLDSDSNTDYN